MSFLSGQFSLGDQRSWAWGRVSWVCGTCVIRKNLGGPFQVRIAQERVHRRGKWQGDAYEQ
jgi:hypothetical protein